jgi:hypothetical protein
VVNYKGIRYVDNDRLSLTEKEFLSAEFQSVRASFRLLRKESALPAGMESVIVQSESEITVYDTPQHGKRRRGGNKSKINEEATNE